MPNDGMQAVLAELGVGDLPEGAQEELAAGFAEVALKSATVAVLQMLPEEKHETFATLAESGDAASIQAFLDQEVPGHEAIAGQAIRDELTRFKESLNS